MKQINARHFALHLVTLSLSKNDTRSAGALFIKTLGCAAGPQLYCKLRQTGSGRSRISDAIKFFTPPRSTAPGRPTVANERESSSRFRLNAKVVQSSASD